MSYNIILRIMNILTALREYLKNLKKICKKFYKCTVMRNQSQNMSIKNIIHQSTLITNHYQ